MSRAQARSMLARRGKHEGFPSQSFATSGSSSARATWASDRVVQGSSIPGSSLWAAAAASTERRRSTDDAAVDQLDRMAKD